MARPTSITPAMQRDIVSARFLCEGEPPTYEVIAERFGVSKGVVVGLCNRARARAAAGGELLPPMETRHTAPTQRQIEAKARGTRLRNPPKPKAKTPPAPVDTTDTTDTTPPAPAGPAFGIMRFTAAVLRGGGRIVADAEVIFPPPPTRPEESGGGAPAPRPDAGEPPGAATAPISFAALAAPIPRSRKCQYPHGEPGQPGFRFCEGETLPGKSWCPMHAKLVFLPTLPPWARNTTVAPR